jgi:hypothetical protein
MVGSFPGWSREHDTKEQTMTRNPYRNPARYRRLLVTGALATGTMLGAAGIASAASSPSTTATSSTSSTATAPASGTAPTGTPPAGAQGNPATLTHGPDETLLTGTELTEATTAATTAVPGATVVRAETNSSGGYPYEVHMKKSDGTYVTVELDSNFTVITTISGFGAGPAGGQAPNGTAPRGSAPPAGAPSSSSSNSTPTSTN